MDQEETSLLDGQVGKIIELSQMVEYILAEMQAYVEVIANFGEGECPIEDRKKILKTANTIYRKGVTQTLGWNISRIKELGLFEEQPEILNKLTTVLKERNYVTHQLFKDDVGTEKIQKHLSQVLSRLENDVGRMSNMNDTLLAILQHLIDQFSKQ